MGFMPAHRGGERPVWSLKEIVITPDNPAARSLDAHQGGVLLHDGETGELRALLNASAITEIRTAAVSAVATRALARPDARVVAIVGAGVQARSLARRRCRRPPRRRDPRLEPPRRRHGRGGRARRGRRLHLHQLARARAPSRVARSGSARGRWAQRRDSARARCRHRCGLRLFVDRRESAVNEAGTSCSPASARRRSPQSSASPDRHASWTLGRRRADRLQVARPRRRGPGRSGARSPQGARPGRRHGGRILIPFAEIERAP